MAANRLKMDAVALVAASHSHDPELTEAVLTRHDNDLADLTRAAADVAALLAGSGAARTALTGYLDYIGEATHNGKRT
jgi:hypothetical protein